MSEKMYTKEDLIEQVQDAYDRAGNTCVHLNTLIGLLKNPPYTPRAGEAYCWYSQVYKKWNISLSRAGEGIDRSRQALRPLTREECGPVGRALSKALRNIPSSTIIAEIKRLEAGE